MSPQGVSWMSVCSGVFFNSTGDKKIRKSLSILLCFFSTQHLALLSRPPSVFFYSVPFFFSWTFRTSIVPFHSIISPFLFSCCSFFWIVLIRLSTLHHLLSFFWLYISALFSFSFNFNLVSFSLQPASFPITTSSTSWVLPWWLYLWDKLSVRHEMFSNFSVSATGVKWAEWKIKSKTDDVPVGTDRWKRKTDVRFDLTVLLKYDKPH